MTHNPGQIDTIDEGNLFETVNARLSCAIAPLRGRVALETVRLAGIRRWRGPLMGARRLVWVYEEYQ